MVPRGTAFTHRTSDMFASKDLFLTQPAGAATGYQISRSVRFRSSASAYFNRTPGSAGNQQKWTWSAWVKRGTFGVASTLFASRQLSTSTPWGFFGFDTTNTISWNGYGGESLVTTAVYRDPSAWYHFVFAVDTTQATAANRLLLYVNGVQVTSFGTATYPSQNANLAVNAAQLHTMGNATNGIGAYYQYFDGYMTEINFIDGQALTPSSFGATSTTTGVWGPTKYTGTYGTNGFYLNFSDNSNNTATTIGKDSSGNGNNWTPNNISVTTGATYDSMTDVPTLTSATAANYAVLNTLARFTGGNTASITNGNLLTTSGGNPTHTIGTMTVPASGKFYFEFTCTSIDTVRTYIGFLTTQTNAFASGGNASYDLTYSALYASNDGRIYYNTGSSASAVYGATYATGDVIGIAYDNGKIWFAKNGTWQASGNPATGANPGLTGWNVYGDLYPYCGYNSTFSANFGQQPFAYTAPTGFKALNTYNLSTPTIANGASYMAASLYTGNDPSTQTITNTVGTASFQPDLVWVKTRSNAYTHVLVDSVRGVSTALFSNLTNAEVTESTRYVYAFNSNGFSVKEDTGTGSVNATSATYVGWQWKAGGSSSSNTNGSITSTVSVSTTAGFSVVTYTGNGGSNQSVGHGLGVTPGMVIIKDRTLGTTNWLVHHQSQPTGYTLYLNLTNAQDSGTSQWGSSAQTSIVFYIGYTAGATGSNNNGDNYVAYCFAPIAGYSAFGSYTGNGSADGPFVYVGFRPRWILMKSSTLVTNWWLIDTARNTYNVANTLLTPSNNYADDTTYNVADINSNGFKIRTTYTGVNSSNDTYVYACFAENPFKYALAR